MSDEYTTGVAFFAYNTDQINYLKLATLAALYVERHMPNQSICLITDHANWEWFQKTAEGPIAQNVFDDVVITNPPLQTNYRTHYDSPYTKFKSDFKNGNKHKVIDFTPYDRTLLLDIDYIVQNNDLEYVFDTDQGVTLFHRAQDIIGRLPYPSEQYLYETGVPMLWSTAIYFDRNDPLARSFFDLWAHVANNYTFYRFLYNFPAGMFRTDFCVSIAAHMLNGMGQGELVSDFPFPMIYMSQRDDIAQVNTVDEWAYLVNDRDEEWKDTLALITKENVHVMNKRALDRQFDKIVELINKEAV